MGVCVGVSDLCSSTSWPGSYYGYTVQRVSGFLHSSLLCVLLGVGIMALGVFLRRHSVLPPPVKED